MFLILIWAARWFPRISRILAVISEKVKAGFLVSETYDGGPVLPVNHVWVTDHSDKPIADCPRGPVPCTGPTETDVVAAMERFRSPEVFWRFLDLHS